MWCDILWLDTELMANQSSLHERRQLQVYDISHDFVATYLVLASHGTKGTKGTKGSPFGSTTLQRKVYICARTLSSKMDTRVV